MGQGYENHLIKTENDISTTDKANWKKINAQLYILL